MLIVSYVAVVSIEHAEFSSDDPGAQNCRRILLLLLFSQHHRVTATATAAAAGGDAAGPLL